MPSAVDIPPIFSVVRAPAVLSIDATVGMITMMTSSVEPVSASFLLVALYSIACSRTSFNPTPRCAAKLRRIDACRPFRSAAVDTSAPRSVRVGR